MSAPPSSIGRYEVLERIGRGGMGLVVKARDPLIRRDVAIKLLLDASPDAEFLERFHREATTAGRLTHPNIVTIFDFGQADGQTYIVMEFVEGDTLEHRMRDVPPLLWPAFLKALGPCADALDYAHRYGVIHRDIKPANIMIRRDSVPKILDFGIAKLVATQVSSLTQAGFVVGSLIYASPEQVQGSPVDSRTDQYSLAVIAYTLLTGQPPFAGGQTGRLFYQILNDMPATPSVVRPLLDRRADAVLLKALAKDPGQRFVSCSEFIRALAAVVPETNGELAGWCASPESPATDTRKVVAAPSPFTEFFERAEQTRLLRKAPDQRVDADTLARAQSRELSEILERRDFESAVMLRGKWLPGIEGAPGELMGFSEAARYSAPRRTRSPIT